MNEAFKQAVNDIMAMFAEEYPRQFQVTKTRSKIWRQMLKDFSPDCILAAGYHLASTGGEFPPPIGVIRLTAARISNGYIDPPDAFEAWENVRKRIASSSHTLSDDEKEACNRVGGIYHLSTSGNHVSDRVAFVKAFEAIISNKENDIITMDNVKKLVETRKKPVRQLMQPAESDVPRLKPSGLTKDKISSITSSLPWKMPNYCERCQKETEQLPLCKECLEDKEKTACGLYEVEND